MSQRPPAYIPQPYRLLAALIYLAALLLLGLWVNGWTFPPYGIRGLWFYSAAAGLILGEFVLEPFFTRPADALANGSALLLTASSVSLTGASITHSVAKGGRIAFVVYAALVLVCGVGAILLKDAGGRTSAVARQAYRAAGTFGRARWLFGALYFAAVYAAYSNSPGRIALFYLAWIVIFSLHPLQRVFATEADSRRPGLLVGAGVVTSTEDPLVVAASLPEGATPRLGQAVRVRGEVGKIVDVTSIEPTPLVRIALPRPMVVPLGAEVKLEADITAGVIGHVSEGTTIEELVVVTTPSASEQGLEEGRLVSSKLDGKDVLFQVTSATIRTAETPARRDVLQVGARKLGVWSDEAHGFESVAWVPMAGSTVSVFAGRDERIFIPENIGHVPATTYGVRLELDPAVTHNTAILGILGSGKTHLAWELMKRLLLDGVKVVALDITGRYAQQFGDIWSEEATSALEQEIERAIRATRTSIDVHDNEAGNVIAFQSALGTRLRQFYMSECPLLILNPLRFHVTKMEGWPNRQGQATTLTRLTMVEVTRLVTETLLEISMEHDEREPNLDEHARLCVVFEEAHSLVPEWNAATGDAEKWAVNGTARAVLQGRKYGFGCLLVTQRTASVTKSILNQCNTVCALRAFDATGAGFLENYVGPVYAPLLASLKERQAIVFGRASSCNAPLIIELNDAAALDRQLWDARKGELSRCDPDVFRAEIEEGALEPEPEPEPEEEPADDDIPF